MAVKKMWDGRFSEGNSSLTEEYTESVSYDRELYRQDIRGSLAHARMLARQGVLTPSEAENLARGLEAVQKEIEAGSFVWKRELEDVHMNIESRLTALVGDLGKKLHTGRSRNDQVALDFRLYVAEAVAEWKKLVAGLVKVIVELAEANRALILPGCTHLQPAQPVSLAHHLLAYAWMLRRDFERMDDALKRVRVSPLGAAALAGTTYPLDPGLVAAEVGFAGIFANSMDAVSDRDFALEPMFCASLCMAHLSRLCEDLILWANPAFGFIRLPDAYSTGSSIMPQKKNPDVAELMRGKTGRVYGALFSLLTTLKGLPMTYNRDLQEDKEPFFDVHHTLAASLEIMAGMLAVMSFNGGRMRESLKRGFVNATELADYLVGKGIPFREAHHLTGRAVALAEGRGVGLEDLTLADYREISPLVGDDVYAVLAFEAAVARRETPGGTGPRSVTRQMDALRAWLGS
jgi:argininosuccinate lyase